MAGGSEEAPSSELRRRNDTSEASVGRSVKSGAGPSGVEGSSS